MHWLKRHGKKTSSIATGTTMVTIYFVYVAGCGKDEIHVGTPVPSSGDGTVQMNGETIPYVVNLEQTSLYLRVLLVDGCILPFHNHVIESTSNVFTFALNADAPSESTFQNIVYVSGLEADGAEASALFDETAGNSDEFDEEDREEIEQSMYEQLAADTYDSMTFLARDITTLSGSGTANTELTMKGTPSEFVFSGTTSFEENGRITIVGSGTIDGSVYGIYSGFGEDCINSQMPLDLTLVLEPASWNDAARIR